MTSFDNPFVRPRAGDRKGFGQSPVFTREAIDPGLDVQEVLGLPSVLFGVGLPDENARAEREADVGNFHGGIIASAYLRRGGAHRGAGVK
jgi:hypothetical protein